MPRARSHPIPPDLRPMLDAEMARAQRRGALIFAIALGLLTGIGTAYAATMLARRFPVLFGVGTELHDLLMFGPYTLATGAAVVLLLLLPRTRRASALTAGSMLAAWWLTAWVWIPLVVEPWFGTPEARAFSERANMALGMLLLFHTAAGLLIPMSLREQAIPLGAIGIGVVAFLLGTAGEASFSEHAGIAFGAICFASCGALASWWRHRHVHDRFTVRHLADERARAEGRYADVHRRYEHVSRAYDHVNKELADARRVHEALFPPPITRGAFRLEYAYEPAAQIGGDFLFVHPLAFPPSGQSTPLSVVLIDVTGHGVTAALAVNRIHNELERLFATTTEPSPAQILAGLNAFTEAVLAPRCIFATAMCLRLIPPPADGAGAPARLQWAGAGHPPAFVLGPGGSLVRLDSSAPMLGVTASGTFEAEDGERPLLPGESVIAYTDGVIESRTGGRGQLGIEGFASMLRVQAAAAPTPGPAEPARAGAPSPTAASSLTRRLLADLLARRAEEGSDDTLLVRLSLAGDGLDRPGAGPASGVNAAGLASA